MEKYFDINKDKHSIRCKVYYNKDLHAATHWIVSTYGFGGNKDNKAIEKFADRITTKYKGYGVITFDWPAHGKDARNRMILSECLEYLDFVNQYAKESLGAQKLYNYSTSMGGYFTLLYLHEIGDPYEKIVLRCPALHFHDSILKHMSDDERRKFKKKKEVTLGFDRKVTITEDFIDDLAAHDVTQYEYFDDADRLLILHGTKDAMVPFEDSAAFADDNVIEIIPVENADHPFTNPKYMDFAIQKTITFFAPQ